MPSITANRITRFCRETLDGLGGGDIGFVDVGSGGELKAPWSLLPPERLCSFDFEPTRGGAEKLPLCISDKAGTAPFFVAHDERASSLHQPLAEFVERYGFKAMLTQRTITVQCTSLDEHFAGRYGVVDAADINVEGHDFQVLQGAGRLLETGAVKLLKVEFELAPAYEGQGYFSDIDALLRARGFRLADIEIERALPVTARHLYHHGEPLWGKALYAPARRQLGKRWALLHNGGGWGSGRESGSARGDLAKAVALYTAARLPGYAHDAIGEAEEAKVLAAAEAGDLRARLVTVFQWARREQGWNRIRMLISSIAGSIARKK